MRSEQQLQPLLPAVHHSALPHVLQLFRSWNGPCVQALRCTRYRIPTWKWYALLGPRAAAADLLGCCVLMLLLLADQ
jgi:hypothetical protein